MLRGDATGEKAERAPSAAVILRSEPLRASKDGFVAHPSRRGQEAAPQDDGGALCGNAYSLPDISAAFPPAAAVFTVTVCSVAKRAR
jgi:hypothetical protein